MHIYTRNISNEETVARDKTGFQFKPKLAAVMAVLNGIAAGTSYIVTAGDLGVTIVITAISVGLTAGVSYYEEHE